MKAGNDEVRIIGYRGGYKHMSERVMDTNGIAPTLLAMTHGWGQGYFLVYEENGNDMPEQQG